MTIHGTLIRNASFPLLAKREGFGEIQHTLKELERSQYCNREQIVELQLIKIKKLLLHAYDNCSFYRKRFDSVGFDPAAFTSLDQLCSIPPLTKANLQSDLSSLIAGNYTTNQIHKDATGGSTGNHTPFYRDNVCIGVKKAFEYRCNRWAGWDIGEKIAYYWPAIQDFAAKKSWKAKLKNQLMFRSMMLYAGTQNDQILNEHYQQLAAFRPRLLRTFPNPLSVLAKYIQQNRLPALHIPSIISVGEPLLESHRTLFEEVFGSKVFNCYVSRECGNMACECGEKPGLLHINAEMVYIEPLDDSAYSHGQPVKFLVTDLTNYGMPFIRYQIEDLGIFKDENCTCGRGLPVFRMEAGRASDFLISPYDRSKISGCSFLHHLIAEGPEVGQIQVVQDKINHLILKIVKSEGFQPEKLMHFDQVIERIFKGKMQYDVDYVEAIEREKSQKYFFTKCQISDEEV